jgi:hypothetical protein
LAAALLESIAARAVTRDVPAEYTTIQSAIDAAVTGDTVFGGDRNVFREHQLSRQGYRGGESLCA